MADPHLAASPCFLCPAPILSGGPGAGPWLADHFGRRLPALAPAAASLEFAAGVNRPSAILEGPLAGLTWPEAAFRFGTSLAGKWGMALFERGLKLAIELRAADLDDSPVFIPAPLPVAKTSRRADRPPPSAFDANLIVAARPGAHLYFGRRKSFGLDDWLVNLHQTPAPRFLAETPAAAGDVFVAPAGAPYALGKGLLAWRVCLGPDRDQLSPSLAAAGGEAFPRDLLSLAPRAFIPSIGVVDSGASFLYLFATPELAAVRLDLRDWRDDRALADGPRPSFVVLTGLEGRALLTADDETETIAAGKTVIVAAHCRRFRISPDPEGVALVKLWSPAENELERELTAQGLGHREIERLHGLFGK